MEGLGSKLLREIEEESLDDFLTSLRKLHSPIPPHLLIPPLTTFQTLKITPPNPLTLTGPGSLPLLYHLISHSITHLNGVVAIIDFDSRFDPSHLTCNLTHVYIFRPPINNNMTQQQTVELMKGVEEWMFGGEHGSMGREWVITAVCGGGWVQGGLGKGRVNVVVKGWSGWLRVEREEVEGFGLGISVEEALRGREERQEIVDKRGWRGVCEEGEFVWKDF